ncbi:hypothetical protein PROFUN_11114 [Planoprotostelium fungivorum]|uniref:Uncharacterized protein n=1 Tax=Planoprotostelium fungivorum TaxID=1890364 RepID=A0A2P6NAQ8_9EUKA|nr:hypothetical protein PROFUN_11114 [Planoprotostelium fungivorum]
MLHVSSRDGGVLLNLAFTGPYLGRGGCTHFKEISFCHYFLHGIDAKIYFAVVRRLGVSTVMGHHRDTTSVVDVVHAARVLNMAPSAITQPPVIHNDGA